MLKRICALLCALLLPACALAELLWPVAETAGQEQLDAYIDRVNENQALSGSAPVNSLFELYPGFAVLGITAQDMAELPEGVEMSFTLEADSIALLQLRSSRTDLFAPLAASCIQAASPEAMTLDEAAAGVKAYMDKVKAAPSNSLDDGMLPLRGEAPRVYYAYYPNQYSDGVNWLQMTLVFPLPGADDAAPLTTPAPTDAEDEPFDGTHFDGGTHLEIFVTPTPEPDM